MNTLLLLPDGLGFRNFVCSRFLGLLVETGQIHIWHQLPEDHIASVREQHGSEIEWGPLPHPEESVRSRVLRQAKVFAQLYWARTHTGAHDLARRYRPPARARSRAAYSLSRALGWAFGSLRGVKRLDAWHAHSVIGANGFGDVTSELERLGCDIVFCTHQRASIAVPIMLAAHTLRIPTATFIHSWDNLPKGRMAVHADHYLVWSDRMKDEMHRFYPDVASHRVHVVGSPQFEIHADASRLLDKAVFCSQLGLDPRRPIVCFSGDDVTTSPHDPLYFRDVAQALRESAQLRPAQLVFRRCPADTSDRFDEVLAEHPEVIVSDPIWTRPDRGDWQLVLPHDEDQTLLANLSAHSDLVVNVGSTMAFDFAAHGNPALYLAYDQDDRVQSDWSIEKAYSLPHFELVQETDPVHWARSRSTLAEEIRFALEHPESKAEAMRTCLESLAAHPLADTSRRCLDALSSISASPVRKETCAR